MMDRDGSFYFMEMNTRLQVEHTVTEMVTGYDLVKWQIRIAAGQRLDFSQKDVRLEGHAIECRINAEDPEQDFRPSCGKVNLLHIPGGPWVRFDTALYQDYKIPPYYDSMIGKLVVYAKTREEAIRKLQAALCELVIEGVKHNAQLHVSLLGDARFKLGGVLYGLYGNQKRVVPCPVFDRIERKNSDAFEMMFRRPQNDLETDGRKNFL